MPQSLAQIYIHIVFSTQERYPWIDEAIEERLFAYLGQMCKSLECQPLIVGGYLDHVHILCRLSRKIAVMNLLKEVKIHSSRWMKEQGEKYESFYWQKGYGAFSIKHKEVERVREYIANQKIHHRTKSFKEEYLTLLYENNIEYDERYVWE